jgi:hypothetical protein
MPLQNRVTPFGEIISTAARGLLMGNRGILHNDDRRLSTARWQHPHWVTCRLEFKGRRQEVMRPGAYTQLFFLDEAVALAAGHRPCAHCRRPDYEAFVTAWMAAGGRSTRPRAAEIDWQLHRERVDSLTRRQVTHSARLDGLPDAAFITLPGKPGAPLLVLGRQLLCWTAEGYRGMHERPRDLEVAVLTPRTTVAALAAGFKPQLHPSAESAYALPGR